MTKILIIEDDVQVASILRIWLTREKYIVESVHEGRAGLDFMLNGQFDLVILDLNMPGLSGFDVIAQYRARSGPACILVSSGRTCPIDKISALDLGADDYMVKPYHLAELSARVRTLLRRAVIPAPEVLTCGPIQLADATKRVTSNGCEVGLSRTEYLLLKCLMRHPGHVFSREAIIEHMYHSDTGIADSAITTLINRLRQKLEDNGADNVIETVRGYGYRLTMKDTG